MISSQFNISKLFQVYSQEKNYEILDFDNHDKRCIVYFSSNGLYYPNQDRIFEKEIIIRNRFEWKKNIVTSVGRIIFVRDITKQWYLTGINAQINTIDKLYEFLVEQTKGLEVICVGSSAGGFAATLFGCLLQASCVFNFSGQFSINQLLLDGLARQKNPTLVEYEKNLEYKRYYSTIDFLKNSDVPIFYFYPSKCKIDRDQHDLVASFENIYSFPFSTAIHGQTCYLINFVDLFNLSPEKVIGIHSHYRNRTPPISQFDFSVKVSGMSKTIKYLIWQLPLISLKKVSRKLRTLTYKAY
jgi:hypothetical protein